ncbi:MAG: BRO family protein [Nanoarchaeota archaeon]
MEKGTIITLQKSFEEFAYKEEGIEFWFARDLQKLLGYDKWENFLNAIDKAKEACKNSGHHIQDHFPEARKMVKLGSGSEKR